MKLNQATLESGKTESLKVSTGNPYLPQAVKTPTLPTPLDQRASQPDNVKLSYNSSKATLWLEEDLKPYVGPIIPYIERYGFKVVRTLEEVLKSRHVGQKVMTLREADIATRAAMDLHDKALWEAMNYFDSFLVEGTPGEPDSPWFLRKQYNRGIEFMRTEYTKAPPTQQARAMDRLTELRIQLAEFKLPLWPEEIEQGFAIDLLKPEYQTWGQYEQAIKRQKVVIGTS